MKGLRKIAAIMAAISFIFAFFSCDTATTSKGDGTPVTYSINISEGIEHGTISVDVTSAEAGTSIKLTAKPENGYVLEAYSVKDSTGKEITVVEGIFLMPESDVTVSATFKAEEPEEIKKWTVTFTVDGESTTQTVEDKTKATKPTDPVKAGYTFDGWYNGTAKFDFDTTITANTTLTAVWAPATNTAYKVLHYKQNVDDDEYTLADTDNLTGTTAAQTSAETKTYAHFTAGSVTQAEIAADGSTQVKIYYTREIITYTIDLAGGTLGDSSENFTLSGKYGQSIEALENPTRQNYKFSGWNTIKGTIPTTLEESATYTALWTAVNGITVTIGTNSTIDVEQEESGTSIVFTAEKDFTDYKWIFDGVAATSIEDASISEDGTVLTIKKSMIKQGVAYPITLSATKKGMPYGTQISLIWYEVN